MGESIHDRNNPSIGARVLADGSFIFNSTPLKIAFEYDGNNRLLYRGEALPSTHLSSTGWRIQKSFYVNDTDYMLAFSVWASSSGEFDKIWSKRGSYAYSTT